MVQLASLEIKKLNLRSIMYIIDLSIITSTTGQNQYVRQITIAKMGEVKLSIETKIKTLDFLEIHYNDLYA